uniref:Uncharacterized protein n=1 Tax=Heterorhabditis bacteriophora TaxID=37862 RepID=A0A1I7WWI5_HETBA
MALTLRGRITTSMKCMKPRLVEFEAIQLRQTKHTDAKYLLILIELVKIYVLDIEFHESRFNHWSTTSRMKQNKLPTSNRRKRSPTLLEELRTLWEKPEAAL